MKKTILLIEPNANVRKAVEILLRKDFKVISTSDIKEGFELLIKNKELICAVICAYRKFEVKIVDFIKISKMLLPEVSFIVFSANSEAVKLKDMGADRVVEKPDAEELKKVVSLLTG